MITDTETEIPKYNAKQIGGNDQLKEMPLKDKQQLYNEIITTVHSELGEEFKNKKEQYVLNMRNIALAETDWEQVGKQVTSSILDKINNILENINFTIVSDDKNNYDQPPLAPPEIPKATVTQAPEEEKKEEEQKEEEQKEEILEDNVEPVDTTDTEPNPDESIDAKPNPDESKETLEVDTTNTQEEKNNDPVVTGGEKLDQDWMDPEVGLNDGQNGGNKKDKKKRQTIRIKYLSKNKTRKNII